MSELERWAEQCTAVAAFCKCVKPAGHLERGDRVHVCDPSQCTGKWSGSIDGPDFEIVEFPQKAKAEPVRTLSPGVEES